MDRKIIILFSLAILIGIGVFGTFFGLVLHGSFSQAQTTQANLSVTSPSPVTSPAALSTPDTTPTIPFLTPYFIPADSNGCPVILTNPPEKFACPRDLPPLPETYHIVDPLHPTQKDIDAIPVNFPGVDRTLLVTIALKDPCVIEFLQSGGNINGITEQPRPSNGRETVRWPPVLLAYRRINCTEMLVLFDIDPKAGNISDFRIEYQ
jgi:hypothetical protein